MKKETSLDNVEHTYEQTKEGVNVLLQHENKGEQLMEERHC